MQTILNLDFRSIRVFFYVQTHFCKEKKYKTHFYDSLLWVSHFYVDEVFFLQHKITNVHSSNFGGHGNRLLLIQLKLLLPSTSRWILTKECSVNQFFSYTDCWRQGWSLEEGDFPNWLNHLIKFICVNTYSFFLYCSSSTDRKRSQSSFLFLWSLTQKFDFSLAVH